jgi:hypothetical protein
VSVDLHVGDKSWPVGSGALLGAFFDTVASRLEDTRRGSKYPLTAKLYQGKLQPADTGAAIAELTDIAKELTSLPPDKLVWDMDDASKKPPWGSYISADIGNLADYFVTNEGEDLIKTLITALTQAQTRNQPLEIR